MLNERTNHAVQMFFFFNQIFVKGFSEKDSVNLMKGILTYIYIVLKF